MFGAPRFEISSEFLVLPSDGINETLVPNSVVGYHGLAGSAGRDGEREDAGSDVIICW